MARAIDRDALHAKLVKAVDAWARGCEATVRPLTDRLIERLKKSKATTPISKIVDEEMKKLGIDASLRKSMRELVIDAVAHGYGVLPTMMADREAVGDRLMTTPWSGDDMTLSERLYQNAKYMRAVVSDAIQTARRQGQTFTQAARVLYDGYNSGVRVIDTARLPQYMANVEQAARSVLVGGDLRDFQRDLRKAQRAVDRLAKGGAPNKALKSAYQQMLDAAQSGSQKHLERAIRTAVEERSRYHAERIARTEAARAYFDGFVARNASDDDVVGYRWTIGGRHPKTDICDEHAAQDAHGLGAGVYPKDKLPEYPAHPHCLCHLSEVYADEVPGYEKSKRATGVIEGRVEAGEIEKPEAETATTTSESQTKEYRIEDDKQYQNRVKFDERLRAKIEEIKKQYPELSAVTLENGQKWRDAFMSDAEYFRNSGSRMFADEATVAEAKAAAVSKLMKLQADASDNEAKLSGLVAKYIEQNNYAKICLPGKLSHETMRELSSGLQRMYKECPGIPRLEFAGSTQALIEKMKADGVSPDTISRFENQTYNQYATTNSVPGYSGITVNERKGNDTVTWKSELKRDVDKKFHPVECDTIKSVMDHEAAHAKDKRLGLSQDPIINSAYDAWMRLSDEERADALCRYPSAARQAALDQGLPEAEARDIGIGEFMAEAASEYKNNASPRAIAKIVGERIMELEEAQKKEDVK